MTVLNNFFETLTLNVKMLIFLLLSVSNTELFSKTNKWPYSISDFKNLLNFPDLIYF